MALERVLGFADPSDRIYGFSFGAGGGCLPETVTVSRPPDVRALLE
jgi:hypothetical protein